MRPSNRSVQVSLHRATAVVAGALLSCLLPTIAGAGITGTSGAISVIPHPTGTLNSNTLESDTTAYIWVESLLLNPGAQSLNHVGSGTVNSTGSANAGTVTPTIAESYLFHFDQAGAGSVALSNITITFAHTIIGVWHTNGGVSGSDAQWGPSGLTYGTFTARPFELGTGATNDRYSISASGRVLTILNTYTTGNGTDQLRILVNPEPSTIALMGLGIAGLGGLVLRRRRRRAPPTS